MESAARAGAMNRKSKGAPGSTVRKKRGRCTERSGIWVRKRQSERGTITYFQVEVRSTVNGRKFHFGTYHSFAEAHAARDFCTFIRGSHGKSDDGYRFPSILTIFEEFEETHVPLRVSYKQLLNLQNSVPRAAADIIDKAFSEFNKDARGRLKLIIENFKKRYPEFMSSIPAVPEHAVYMAQTDLKPSEPCGGEVILSGERGRILLREADCRDPTTSLACEGLNLLKTRFTDEHRKQLLDLLNDVGYEKLAQIILRSYQCLPCQASRAERVNNQERGINDPIVLLPEVKHGLDILEMAFSGKDRQILWELLNIHFDKGMESIILQCCESSPTLDMENDIFQHPLENCEVDPSDIVDISSLVDEQEANLSGFREKRCNDSWQSEGLAGADGGAPLLGNLSPVMNIDLDLDWTSLEMMLALQDNTQPWY